MAQDFMTMTPGSAVADTLQEILARRRADARQAMLDQLTAEQTHSQIENEAKRTGFEGERVGLEKTKAADELKNSVLNRSSLQQQMMLNSLANTGENADLSQMPADEAAYARTHGLYEHQPGTTPMSQSSYGAALPDATQVGDVISEDPVEAGPSTSGHDVFSSPKKRAEAAQEQEYANVIAQHPELFKDNDALKNVYLANSLGIPEPLTPEMVNAPPSLTSISPEGKQESTIHGVRGTQFMPRPYPPSSYQPSVMPVGIDQTSGEGLFMTNRTDAKGMPVIMRVPGMGSVQHIPTPSNQAANDKLIQATGQLRMALSSTGANRDQAVASAKAALLASKPMSQTGYQALNNVIDHLPPNASLAGLPSNLEKLQLYYPNLTPQDLQTIREILTVYLSAGAQ